MRKLAVLPLVALLALALAGCGAPGAGSEGSDKVRVVATLPFIADMVSEVGGDRVEVASVVEPGAAVHTFQPSPSDARELSDAAVVFENGLGLEQWLGGLVESAGNDDVAVVELAEGLRTLEDEHGGGDEHAQGNPHLWLDVSNGQRYVERIRDTLAEADPEGAAEYEANAERYLAELEELDAYIKSQIQTIPEDDRKLVTFHDGFPYFAEAYGLEMVGVILQNPNAEASSREVAEITRTIESLGVPAIFTEPQFNSGIADAIAQEADVEVYRLYATLAPEGGVAGEEVGSYEEMLRTDVDNIVEGLGR